MLTVSKNGAVQFLIKKQGLDRRQSALSGSEAVAAMVKMLEIVQLDPVLTVDRNHHLVLYNRLSGFQSQWLEEAVANRLLLDYICTNRCFIPMHEYPWFAPLMRARECQQSEQLAKVGEAAAYVLRTLAEKGPQTSRQIEFDQARDRVQGYWDQYPKTKASTLALHILWECGRVIAAARPKGEIVFDLPERAIPEDLRKAGQDISIREAVEYRRRKYYRALRLIDANHQFFGWSNMKAAERLELIEKDVQAGILIPVTIKDVRRKYWILAEDADELVACETAAANRGKNSSAGRGGGDGKSNRGVRILSPLDNFLWRRERLQDLLDFDYTWEIYIPEHKRKYGPYTMPILADERLVGRIDLKYDRPASTLLVNLLAWEPWLGQTARRKLQSGLNAELDNLCQYLGATNIR